MTVWLNALKRLTQKKDPAHDWAHIQRVVANCRLLAKAEGADLEILIAAALLHDIVNPVKAYLSLSSGRCGELKKNATSLSSSPS
ncbi:MAG: HD domain-containing protein [Bdellovibrionales bacterium]|nr:HD domain-containing protein [Bdellovibrionales bacterium]